QTYANAGRIDGGRFVRRGALVILILMGLLLIPFPHRISAPALIELQDAKHVYVTSPGFVASIASPQTVVEPGALIARLQNDQIDLEILKLKGQISEQQIRITSLKTRQVDDPEAARELPTAEEQLTDLKDQLEQRLTDQRRLTLTAPVEGTLIPAPRTPAPADAAELPDWVGSPFDADNQHCFLKRGTWLCSLGNPRA
ncbi:MAG: hypothetical protein RLO18_14485, partial [Gimesia chilikensis]